MKHGNPLKYENIASFLADEGSDIQAKFFSIFAQKLRQNCKTHYNTECQMFSILNNMTEEDKNTMSFNYKS